MFLWNAHAARRTLLPDGGAAPWGGVGYFDDPSQNDTPSVRTEEDFIRTKKELEKLQIQTIYSLVEKHDIQVAGGRTASKQML